jgi:radical SAM protein with 4Fe4S-binding SPASM domain
MSQHIQGADLRNKNRLPLQDVVPLPAPLLMYLEPVNTCNIRCSFCPTGDRDLLRKVGRPQGVMSWSLLRKIVADLKEFPQRLKMIDFFKDGEPLTNKNYPEMASYLRAADVTEKMWTKTNGLLLSPVVSERLAVAGFDMIGISVIAPTAAGYKRIAGVDMDYAKLVDDVGCLYNMRGSCKMYVKMIDMPGFAQADRDKFLADFGDKCDYIAIENLHGWSRTDLKDFTLGTHPSTFDGVPNKSKIVCPWTLYQLTVNWNGAVQLCNEDWSWQNIVGNVNKSSLLDIWNSDAVYAFRRMHLEGRRMDNAACGSCYQTMSQLDDVDAYRQEILQRLRQ